ncbi:hypothetical protein PABG_00809 [Paracoccidioides brasiliensis Pb03]|nr:hypothetical protein PABG_00809 [Paracoccidioides brasiliensis Pb03]
MATPRQCYVGALMNMVSPASSLARHSLICAWWESQKFLNTPFKIVLIEVNGRQVGRSPDL